MTHEQDDSFTAEQTHAANAAQALVDLLRAAPLKPNQMERFHLLLGRSTDAARITSTVWVPVSRIRHSCFVGDIKWLLSKMGL